MDARLPAHLEVGGLIRAVEAAGGFVTVLHRGEREAGTIMLVLSERGAPAQAYERMPQSDGTRRWVPSRTQATDDPRVFWEWCERRHRQDGDLWVVELDVADGQRFIA